MSEDPDFELAALFPCFATLAPAPAAMIAAAGWHRLRFPPRTSKSKGEFPDCDTGAMPPFGNLYGMKVFVEQSLREDDEIAFNAGTHSELIRLTYADYERLVHPTPLTN